MYLLNYQEVQMGINQKINVFLTAVSYFSMFLLK